MPEIEIYDTTLRDGAQMRDISFSVHDKLRILSILDEFGITYIEGGWPGANPKDVDFFAEAKKIKLKNSTLTAFGSTRKANTSINNDPILQALLRAETKVICIVSKSSAWQVEQTLKASLDQNLTMLAESIDYLKSNGREVFVDAEHFFDGYKNNSSYAQKFIEISIQAKASRMILCDTNGGSVPEEIFEITKTLTDKYGEQIIFGIHAHNDGELAVANSLSAVRAGATQVQGTINGYGERCGNANLISIIPNLQLKYPKSCIHQDKLQQLSHVARAVAEIANMNLNQSQAFVGTRAFTHKGGLHASAIAKDKSAYEHIDPALVGNSTQVVVSDQSGLSNIIDWLRNNHFDFVDNLSLESAAKEILFALKDLEHQGYSFENADASFELMLRKTLADKYTDKLIDADNLNPLFFNLIESNVHIVNGERTEATVRIEIAGTEIHSASTGNGPANALDQALRKALRDYYPELDNFQLQDFKVRILDSHLGSAARTKVQITTAAHGDNPESWDTIGLSANIIKASWDAIVDSVSYGLIKFKTKPKTKHAN
jgi:2-isopropylmalate synthase